MRFPSLGAWIARHGNRLDRGTQTEGDQRKLRLARRPLGLKVPKSPTATIEVSIDDRLFKVTRPVPTIDINWPEKTSGIYDIRVTLTGLDRTQPRVTFLSEIDVDGDHPAPTAKLTKPREDVEGFGNDGTGATALEVMLECPGADRIELMHWGKTVAKVDSESGAVKVETKTLGGGPLRMRPVAYFGDTKVRGATFVDQVGLSK